MPYNPGVTDISGQLLAQGRMSAAKSIGQGFQDFSANMANYMEEVKTARAKNKALEDLIKTHQQEFGFKTPEALDAFLAENPRENAMQRYSRMGQFIEGTMTAKKLEQAQQAIEQNKFIQQQALAKQEQEKRDQEALNRVLGMMAPKTTSQAGEAITQGGFGADITGMSTAPVKVNGAPQSIQEIASQLQGVSPKTIAEIDQFLKMVGPQKAGRVLDPTAAMPEYDPATGKTWMVVKDKQTGEVISRGEAPRSYASPEEMARSASLTKEAETEATSANTHLDSVRASAETSEIKLRDIRRIHELIDEGAKTGWGQPVINRATALLTRAGLWDASKQAKAEELQSLLSRDALAKTVEYMKGQGSITEAERSRIDAIAANVSMTPGANKNLLAATEAIAIKAKEAERLRRKLKEQKMSNVQISEELRNWSADNPFENFMLGNAEDIYNDAMKGKTTARK